MTQSGLGMKIFLFPTIVGIVGLIAVLLSSGLSAFFTALLLVLLEVTLSFDNAVVNARILKDMSPLWQRRFLTWGIAIAVFGTRIILPILIVGAVSALSPWVVAKIAATDPVQYAHLLETAHHSIAAFGAAFLCMVALRYFFDVNKETHWIGHIERHLAKLGAIQAVEIAVVLSILLIVSMIVPDEQGTILAAGVVGIVLFVLMEGLTTVLSLNSSAILNGGLGGFLYLEALDTAFSLDGVVGAFAITSNLLIIAIGLGLGAYFVRSMTVYLVREGTLTHLRYLEHGAHWAILGLGGAMALSLVTEVPEAATALIGIIFIGASYVSSIRERTQLQGRS